MRIKLFSKIAATIVGFKLVELNYKSKKIVIADTQDDNEKLISVILIGRHGARTPFKLFDGIEEVNSLRLRYMYLFSIF